MNESEMNEMAQDLKAIGFRQVPLQGLPPELQDGMVMFTASPPEPDDETWEVISTYSRAQAIKDGVLVDLMADDETKALVHEAGFRLPVAMTIEAFGESILAGTVEQDDHTFEFPAGQSVKGRLWDVLMVLRVAIRAGGDTDRVSFKVSVYVGDDAAPKTVSLWCQIGPGDTAAPVLTIMLEGQD